MASSIRYQLENPFRQGFMDEAGRSFGSLILPLLAFIAGVIVAIPGVIMLLLELKHEKEDRDKKIMIASYVLIGVGGLIAFGYFLVVPMIFLSNMGLLNQIPLP
jgi:multisubunit Na+/H+ antiporter MnhB subunit